VDRWPDRAARARAVEVFQRLNALDPAAVAPDTRLHRLVSISVSNVSTMSQASVAGRLLDHNHYTHADAARACVSAIISAARSEVVLIFRT